MVVMPKYGHTRCYARLTSRYKNALETPGNCSGISGGIHDKFRCTVHNVTFGCEKPNDLDYKDNL